jgi:biotin carboxyl carrier protein
MRYSVTITGRTVQVDLLGNRILVEGRSVAAELHAVPGTPLRRLAEPNHTTTFAMTRTADGWRLLHRGEVWDAEVVDERTRQLREMTDAPAGAGGRHVVRAPMPGLVIRVEVEPGADIVAGGGLVVLEAMKMENELTSPIAGAVTAVHVSPGDAVDKGTPLVEVSGEP